MQASEDFHQVDGEQAFEVHHTYPCRYLRNHNRTSGCHIGRTESGVVDGLENGKNVVLKSVNIRPLPEFVDMVKESLKPRVKSRGFHSDRISDAEIESRLADYLKENESITRSVVEQKFHINRTRAARILKRLVQEGKLKNIGFSNHPRYVAVEDNTSESINNENVL